MKPAPAQTRGRQERSGWNVFKLTPTVECGEVCLALQFPPPESLSLEVVWHAHKTRFSAASGTLQGSILWVKMESLLPKGPSLGSAGHVGGGGAGQRAAALQAAVPLGRSPAREAPRWVARGVGLGQSAEKGLRAPESKRLAARRARSPRGGAGNLQGSSLPRGPRAEGSEAGGADSPEPSSGWDEVFLRCFPSCVGQPGTRIATYRARISWGPLPEGAPKTWRAQTWR